MRFVLLILRLVLQAIRVDCRNWFAEGYVVAVESYPKAEAKVFIFFTGSILGTWVIWILLTRFIIF